jgi:hypothetical protein
MHRISRWNVDQTWPKAVLSILYFELVDAAAIRNLDKGWNQPEVNG